MAMNIHGGGAGTNEVGLKFEQDTSLDNALASAGYAISNGVVYDCRGKIALIASKNDLYKKLLEPRGIDYKKTISKKLLPDDALYVYGTNTVYIIEKKFQHKAGSVDEKLQTCAFKKRQYQRLFKALGTTVEYLYVCNTWFKRDEYRDVREYINEVGCHIFFDEIPIDFLGLTKETAEVSRVARKKERRWEPDDFDLQMTTVWSFPKRGDWATHNSKYRGNWSPYIPRNLLLRYSKVGDAVLDQFAGGGTTLVEAKLLNRNIIGVDINPGALALCEAATDFQRDNCGQVCVKHGDARKLDFIPDESVDFICTHPPYANIIQYSESIEGDLSHLNVPDFLEEMKLVAAECFRVLKKDKFCAILMGDTRQKGHMIPMSFHVMRIFLDAGFRLKELIIKEQHNCKATGYWKTSSVKYNFLLIAHEYLFVFRK